MFDQNRLDAVLEEIRTRWEIPGMGVGIVEQAEIVYARGFGVQSLETETPVTGDSVFCLASIAKCLVASAVMKLVKAGKITLDAPLVHHLPYFRLDDERYPQITVRQMLSHTSGMPDMDEGEYDDLVSHPETDDGAAERYVRALSGRKLVAAPDSRFRYSNIAYNVLGDLIAKVSGQAFESHMEEHILLPSGMPASTFFPPTTSGRLALPHLRAPRMVVNPIYPYHRADAPASFLYSSVADMCHWCVTCLSRGVYHGRRVLAPESYDLMWTPVAQRGTPPSLYEDMGLGWTLGHRDGVKTVSHGGAGFGWTGFFVLLPEENCGAIVLCNEESSAHLAAVRAVINAMLNREPVAGTVSWMIPICRALNEGGIEAAYDCCARIKRATDEYYSDEYELVGLAHQLVSAGNFDLAVDVLKLNLHAFPQHVDSHLALAKLYLAKGQREQARATLRQALAIDPGHSAAAGLLETIQ